MGYNAASSVPNSAPVRATTAQREHPQAGPTSIGNISLISQRIKSQSDLIYKRWNTNAIKYKLNKSSGNQIIFLFQLTLSD